MLGLLLLLLIHYKGAAGLNKIRQTRATGSLHLAGLQIGSDAGNDSTALHNALAYLKIVWPALFFGVLISAAARTSLSRTSLGGCSAEAPCAIRLQERWPELH